MLNARLNASDQTANEITVRVLRRGSSRRRRLARRCPEDVSQASAVCKRKPATQHPTQVEDDQDVDQDAACFPEARVAGKFIRLEWDKQGSRDDHEVLGPQLV